MYLQHRFLPRNTIRNTYDLVGCDLVPILINDAKVIFSCAELVAIEREFAWSNFLRVCFPCNHSPPRPLPILTCYNCFPGVIDHGCVKLFYIDFTEFGKGANLGCSVLLLTLVQHAQIRGYLPPKLTLQSDNTAADFKNGVTFQFLGYLVSRGVFQEVR